MENKILGLSSEEVNKQVEAGLVNDAVVTTDKTNKEIVLSNIITYFNIIFIILAILVIIAGSFRNLTFMLAVICNTVIGIYQELRAKKTLDEMSILNAPYSTVIRDGQESQIESNKLVKGDVVIFKAGDQICADGVVLKGEAQVNESLLTGEEDNIKKEVDSKLLSGSFVVSGSVYCKLESVGKDSYISKLSLEAKSMGHQKESEMIKSINAIVKWVGIIIIPMGIALFYQAKFVNGETFSKSIVSMVAAVIGMIPEGLYLLTTVALALSTIRLSKNKVLLHDMKSIEALARVDVLCVDKTGTITEPDMKVSDIVLVDGNDNTSSLLKEYARYISDNNASINAIREYLKDTNELDYLFLKEMPFSSDKKYGMISFNKGDFVLGAPEFVLKERYKEYESKIEEYTSKGARVLLFGKLDKFDENKINVKKLEVLAYVILENKIRDNARETFGYFKKQGVKIKVISGDNPKTVSEVAQKAGIEDSENYVDASTLSIDEIDEAAIKYTVFGRVSPKQKQALVKALKAHGHTVAMTGDGVNDILAMKDADCSIAMASGCKATCQAAQTVLLDSDFSSMPSVVLEGRRVVNNIQRSASLFLVKNIFSFLMAIFSLVLTITYPLEPNQISLIAGFTVGIPGFLLALEPNGERIKGKFIKNVLIKAFPAGITDVVSVGIFVICGSVFSISTDEVSTVSTMILASVGFMIMIYISKPFDRYKYIVLGVNVLGLLVSIFYLKDLFSIKPISSVCFLLMVVFVLASITIYDYLTKLAVLLDDKIEKISTKRKKNA